MTRRKPLLARLKSRSPMLVMILPVVIWLAVLVLIPLVMVIVISFCGVDEHYNISFDFTMNNYKNMLNADYFTIYSNSLLIAFLSTALCIVFGYPFAYKIARASGKVKNILYMMVIIPFWTNSLIRIYGWRNFLGTENGFFNQALLLMGITDEPIKFLFNRGTVVFGMAYTLFPFMILPLYSAIEKLDGTLLEASNDLGAKPYKSFLTVTLPLTFSGIFAGSIMVFIPTLGYFFVSDILGGGNSSMIGNLIERQFQAGNNWPLGSALSVGLIVITLILVALYKRAGGKMDALGG